ncbi:MAG: hypothetical protein RLZZ385_2671 [Pseudomonadota bacterium]|jgi:aryl-alcohol dehydrogenase-like predicted oxidoreductase
MRPLGRTGLQVSCIGLGTVKLGRDQGVKYPTGFTIPDDTSVTALLDTARELGINLIDTAPAYGSSETRLGSLLTDRDHWLICTKVGEEFEQGRSRFDFSGAHTRVSVERSLHRLRTDVLDIVLVHSDGNDLEVINRSDCLATLLRLQEAGMVRAVGFSGKTVEGGLLALQYCDVVMVSYNPAATGDAVVIDSAAAQGKGVLIKKGLQSGHLVQHPGTDPVQDNFDFIFARPGISSVITGTINSDHLRHNADCASRALQGKV